MKYVMCKRLAACLRMKPSRSPSVEPPLIYLKRRSVAMGDRLSNGPEHHNADESPQRTRNNESANKLLQEICDLLENRLHSDMEQRYDEVRNNEIKNDWMLAAAVVDRICAVAFAVIFVAGSVLFFTLFTTQPYH